MKKIGLITGIILSAIGAAIYLININTATLANLMEKITGEWIGLGIFGIGILAIIISLKLK